MTSRDHFQEYIECSHCRTTGYLHLSEAALPLINEVSRKIEKIEGEFTAIIEGNLQVQVTCKSCGNVFTA